MQTPERKTGLFNRPKPRRLKRGGVSLDDTLISASARPALSAAPMPLVRGLAVPLCSPTAVAPPINGQAYVEKLEAKDVIAAKVPDATLAAVLLGLAQVRPDWAKKVVMTRHPSEDVIVRLYHETGNGLIFPTWVLAKRHQAAPMEMDPTTNQEAATEVNTRKSLGVLFCHFLWRALAPSLKILNGRNAAMRLASLLRSVTGRNLAELPLAERDACWEQLLQAVCEHRPVYASTSETNPQHAKHRRFSASAPLVVLEAFELRGERYVCVFDPQGAAEGTAPAPKDLLLADFISELDGLYALT